MKMRTLGASWRYHTGLGYYTRSYSVEDMYCRVVNNSVYLIRGKDV